jgi:hypothetical protein
MDEVRPTDGVEPVVETVDAPTLMIEDQAREVNIAWEHTDTERETVSVSPSSSLVSTEATTVVATTTLVGPTGRSTCEATNEIMLMLEKTMDRVCKWSERVEAQTAATAGREVTIWKRRLVNCEESLKRKGTALTEAEEGRRSSERRWRLRTRSWRRYERKWMPNEGVVPTQNNFVGSYGRHKRKLRC